MRKFTFVNNQFYHIYNRGVEKRDIFMNEKDYIRFIHDLYEFNSNEYALKFRGQLELGNKNRESDSRHSLYSSAASVGNDRLVNILCFCLMQNHFHLILEQLVDNGIPRFMQKLGTGYTNSFNLKYDRVGSLFQGKYKAIHINSNEYLLHLSAYVNLN